jgi:choline kinase
MQNIHFDVYAATGDSIEWTLLQPEYITTENVIKLLVDKNITYECVMLLKADLLYLNPIDVQVIHDMNDNTLYTVSWKRKDGINGDISFGSEKVMKNWGFKRNNENRSNLNFTKKNSITNKFTKFYAQEIDEQGNVKDFDKYLAKYVKKN